jgi:GNAT superfamily N-acetyltransferase
VSRIQPESRPRLFAIRHACAGDAEAIRRFLDGLSPQSRYLRFFTGAPSVTAATLRMLTGTRPGIDVIVATEAGVIIGHAMAADSAGRRGDPVTEIGVAVTDARQRQGVGSALVRVLVGRARARGVGAVTMDVLADNQAVLGMIARRWPDASYSRSGACVTVHARLWPAGQLPVPAAGQPAALATAVVPALATA